MDKRMLLSNLDVLATAPGGVARLRELILTLAVQGKLLPQDPADEPASVLLQKIRAEKDRLMAEGRLKRDKPLAEITAEEKPFELPVGWAWVRFGDASINRDGERVPVSSSDRENLAKTYDYYGASGVIDKIDGFLFDKTLLLIGEDGANLINRSTPIAFLAHGKYWVNNHAHVIDTTHPELMTYLALFINAISLEPYVTGTAQPKMNQAKLNSIVIALPPLPEQSRIVARVEELMRLCDALEAKGQLEAAQHAQLVSTLLGTLTASTMPDELAENWQRVAQHFDLLLDRPEAIDALEQTLLQLAVRGLLVPQDPTDEPASALLQKIRAEKDRLIATGQINRDKPLPTITDEEKPFELPVGWEWVRFDELIHPQKPIAYGVLVPGPDVPTGVPFVRIADLSIVNPPERPEKTITPEVDAQFPRTRLEGGEILMGVVGSIGKLGVAPKTWVGANIARAICRIVPADAGLHEFVLFLLETKLMQESFAGDTRTLAQPTLNIGLIRAALTPMPPPAEQSRIVTRVAALRRLCADLRQRLADAQTTQSHLAQALVESTASV
jgi:type I restriction enzyme, S subunit